MPVIAGQMLSHYRLTEKIGEGGMGMVWKAVDTKLGREVAIKVLSPSKTGDPNRLRRFQREGKAVAALNHPNIVTIHSVEEAGGIQFITMEMVEGKTLADVIPADGLPLGEFFALAVPLTDALTAAHERGIIHRDLKPANIMITDDGRLKVLDFGLAKLREQPDVGDSDDLKTATDTELTRAGQIVGTVPYMSPEQLQSRPLDHRSDLFSLGVILYEMATGRRPFSGRSSMDLISSILRDAPRAITDVKIGFPNHLGRIVRHCLEKDVERRYQTAKDLRNELEDLRGELATGELPGRARVGRPVRSLVAVAILAAVLLLAGGIVLLRRGLPGEAGNSTIAVLPFVNLTGDPGQAYLGQGISAALTTQLSEVSGVHVLGHSSFVDDEDVSPAQLAQRLGVAAFLEGAVQRSASRLKVDVKLTDAGTGLVLWSEALEGTDQDLFGLQRAIARKLATVLSIPLSRGELRRLTQNPTTSLKAYDYLLRGYQLLEDGDPGDLEAAIQMFRQAIRLDAQFALAHVGLSDSLWRSYHEGKARERLTEAEQEAERAAAIDPELPAAQVALARVYRSTGRYSASIEELQQVLANHPKPDEAQRELAESYERVGDLEEVENSLRAATALGPKHWFNWNLLGAFFVRLGRYAEAREAFELASELAPQQVGGPRRNLAALTIQEGRFDDAVEIYEELPGPVRDSLLASNIGTAYYFSSHADKWAKAEEHYRLAVRLAPRDAMIRRNLADLYRHLEREAEALEQYHEALLLVEEQLEDDPRNQTLRLQQAVFAAKADECTKAEQVARELEAGLPHTARDLHQLAYVYALCGPVDRALGAIRTAVQLGYPGEIIRREDEFRDLRSNVEFIEITRPEP